MSTVPINVMYDVIDRASGKRVMSSVLDEVEVNIWAGIPPYLREYNIKSAVYLLVKRREKFEPITRRKLSGIDWSVDVIEV